MRRWLVLFVFLMGAVRVGAQHPAAQENSMIGLEFVDLRVHTSDGRIDIDTVHGIVTEALASAKVQIGFASRGEVADPPFLRLSYEIRDEMLDDRQVSVYWVSLELVQAVNWTWIAENVFGKALPDGGLAVTWSTLHTGVASDREAAEMEIEKEIRGLSNLFAAYVRAVNPVWEANGIGLDADGKMKCEYMTLRPRRKPKP